MHVADVEAGALSPQAAGSQGREGALVAQLGQWIGLLHKLGKLARSVKLPQGGHNGPDVDQGDWGELVLVADRHPLPDHPFHPAQADTEFILDQLAHSFHPSVAEVIDIIGRFNTIIDQDHSTHQPDQIPFGQCPMFERDDIFELELLVEFISTDTLEIVVPLVEQLLFQELLRILKCGRIARPHPLEELDQGGLCDGHIARQFPFGLLTQRRGDKHAVRIVIHIFKETD